MGWGYTWLRAMERVLFWRERDETLVSGKEEALRRLSDGQLLEIASSVSGPPISNRTSRSELIKIIKDGLSLQEIEERSRHQRRETNIALISRNELLLERVAASLLGILSLGLLDLSFWEVRIGSYGWINMSSGLQLVLEGANPNLADLIWNAFPVSVIQSLRAPGIGYFTMPAILFMWWVILGALLVEVMGFVAILFTEREFSRKFGRMIALGGKFVFVGGLFTAVQILYYLSQFSNTYYASNYGFGFYPGFALIAEPLLGIGMWILGSRIRHAHRLRAQA